MNVLILTLNVNEKIILLKKVKDRLYVLLHLLNLNQKKVFLFLFFSPCISLFKVYFLLVLVREHSNIHFLFSLLYFSFRSLDFRPICCTCVRLSNVLIFLSLWLSFSLSLSLTSISRMSLSNIAISLRFLVWTWMSFVV